MIQWQLVLKDFNVVFNLIPTTTLSSCRLLSVHYRAQVLKSFAMTNIPPILSVLKLSQRLPIPLPPFITGHAGLCT